jgi:hypothetical protein
LKDHTQKKIDSDKQEALYKARLLLEAEKKGQQAYREE